MMGVNMCCRDRVHTTQKFLRLPYAQLQQQAHLIAGWDNLVPNESNKIAIFR